MKAPLPSRLLRPVLGSGEEEEPRIFSALGDTGILARPAPPLPVPPDLPAPEPGFLFAAPELPAVKPEARRALAPTPEAKPEDEPAPLAAAPLPPPPAAPAPPEDRILVERIGEFAIRVTGTSRGDILVGGPSDDRLDGREGDDVLLGSPGRDLLYGGPGHDTIRYDLLRAEVSLDTRFQRISLEDGEDQYDGIEVIDLRDGDWILTASDPAALVQRLFLAAGRAPSAVEMIRETAALEAGGSGAELAARLGAAADETVRQRLQAALEAPREGRLDQPVWLPDPEAEMLTRMAGLALGAMPGRDAFLHWLDELEAGRSAEAVAAELLATPEGRAYAPLAEAQAVAAAARDWML